MNNLSRQHSIFKQWKNFLEKGTADPKLIRSEIFFSWIRSGENNIDPFASVIPSVSEDQLKNRRKKSTTLLDASLSYMDTIYGFASDRRGIIALADKDGVILECSYKNTDSFQKGTPSPGMIFNEKNIGTNTIGSAIINKSPAEVSASEHYIKILHRWNSSADVIKDSRGNIIGALAYFTSLNRDNFHTLSMIAASAGAIERQLKVEKSLKEKSKLFKLQNLIMDLIDEGILVLDTSQRIIAANKLACELLSINSREITGKSVYDFIRSGINFLHIISEGIDIKEREATVKLKNSVKKFNMSVNLIKEETTSQVEGLVITIRENKRVHNFVNKISGSKARLTFNDIIGKSPALKETIKLSKSAASSSSNVLLLGESGTGKELFAQSIHNSSSRKEEPFVSVNCGAIPRGLVESELFGYEGGAFTGSKKEGHPGKFELADGGTIFLDEIGDMPIDAQVDLLRVIETGEVVRVGGKFPKKVNVRVIAATNVNLIEAVKEKTFRDDLYYRLNVLSINIPPLRKRFEDIKPLIDFFMKKVSEKLQKTVISIEKNALDLFYLYDWPGNVRELENVIERAVNIATDEVIKKSELPYFLKENSPADTDKNHKKPDTIKGQEALHIASMLKKNETCMLHAVAILKGLAENEMCLPYTIDKLHNSITELEKTKAALKHSEKLASMGQLAAGIAHEVNNPLGVVLLYSNLLLDEIDRKSENYKDIKMVAEQAERCKNIVGGLLNFARKNDVTYTTVNVFELVKSVLKSIIKPEKITLEIINNSKYPEAEFDSEQIRQVLTNILKNAVEAIDESNNGKILVLIEGNESEVVIKIEDNGPGIENMDKIFVPFYTTKPAGKGTGLGLPVSYGIVKMHRGTITTVSNNDASKGETGTTFTIKLPRKQPEIERGHNENS